MPPTHVPGFGKVVPSGANGSLHSRLARAHETAAVRAEIWDNEAELHALMEQKQREEDAQPYNQPAVLRNSRESRSRLVAREVARRSLGRKGGDEDILGFMLPSSTAPGEDDMEETARQVVSNAKVDPAIGENQVDAKVDTPEPSTAALELSAPQKRLSWDERYATKSRRAKRHMRFGRKRRFRKTQEAAKAAARGAEKMA